MGIFTHFLEESRRDYWKSGVFLAVLDRDRIFVPFKHKKSQSIKTGLIGFSESMIHMRIYEESLILLVTKLHSVVG